jgi:dTDP-4-amino-4,6-dideoxygalactose transaminase
MPIILRRSSIEKRDEVRKKFQEKGIQTSNHYPAVHKFSCYNDGNFENLPNTEYVADNEITLPMYAGLTDNQVFQVCTYLKEILK